MKIAINTSTLSLRLFGRVLLGAGVVLLGSAIVVPRDALVGLGLGLGVLGLAAAGLSMQVGKRYVVRSPSQSVLQQLARTLELMGWRWSRRAVSVEVPALHATITARPFFSMTLLSFSFAEGSDPSKAEFLVKTLIKFQRR